MHALVLSLVLAGTTKPAPGNVDPRALALFERAEQKLRSIRSLEGICQTEFLKPARNPAHPSFELSVRFKLMRPNYALLSESMKENNGVAQGVVRPSFHTWSDDGESCFSMDEKLNFSRSKAEAFRAYVPSMGAEPLLGFFDEASPELRELKEYDSQALVQSARTIGRVDGLTVVRARLRVRGTNQTAVWDFSFAANSLLVGTDYRQSDGRRTICRITQLHLNPALSPGAFRFNLPAGAHETAAQTLVTAGVLRPMGRLADFQVQGTDGMPIGPSDFEGKTVVVDCWASWCLNCTALFPRLDQLARTLRPRGVVFVAVDVSDRVPVYRRWLRQHAASYPNLIFAIDPLGIEGHGVFGGAFGTFIVGRDWRYWEWSGELDESFEAALANARS